MSIPYEDIDFNDGDIILFSGKWSFTSWFVKFCTWSRYSHIGMILKNPLFTHPPLDGIYLIESVSGNLPDAENNREKIGVQIVSIEDRLRNYNGDLYYRKLNCDRNESFYKKLSQVHSDVHNIQYDDTIFDWIKAKFNIELGNVQKLNEFWCSALTSYIYVKLDLLTADTIWTLDTPKEWGTEDIKHSSLEFVDCNLDTELKIIFNS
jgi:hypothetical protein